MDNVIFLFLKITDLAFTVNQHFEGGRLHPAHGQGLVVEDGEKPCGVDPHQPIRLRPAKGRLVQAVVVSPWFQMGKAVLNGRVLHAGNPKTFERLFAARHLVDETENQLSLAVAHTRLSTSGRSIRERKISNCFFFSAGMMYCHSCGKIGRSS